MFTGIVEELGTVRSVARRRLVIGCRTVLDGTRIGDSIAVNGVCVTVTELADRSFAADLMDETLARSALADLAAGAPVNLERAVRADARLGGHLVQGHVDGVVQVVAVEPLQEWTVLTVTLPHELAPYVAEKGSVSLDGVSLTVMGLQPDRFQIGLIPHTLAATTLGRRVAGDRVNMEADVIAKYVERLLTVRGRHVGASATTTDEPQAHRH